MEGKDEKSKEERFLELSQDLQNSVTLKRNAKGEYAWDIKCYYHVDALPEAMAARVARINGEMLQIFGK